MSTTRVFKSGNSQAVRIPSDIAYDRNDIELEIERIGDEIRIRPVAKRLINTLDKFSQFSPDFMREGRDESEEATRDRL
ncbi:MAG: AbrB/MazE/SpoVT family DNA-binding domain-containing protein [Sulfuriferula sp.]|nr:AbrB/MazE/SpoVT family DNA-binding domain-containing protein [Sulfuriferula sp.]